MLDAFPSEESILRRRLHVRRLSMVAVAVVSAAVSAFAAWHLKPAEQTSETTIAGPRDDVARLKSNQLDGALAQADGPTLEADVPINAEPQLQVISEPPGAQVTINGIGRGVTPLTVRHLDAGEQRVRITLDGYDSVDRTIFLAEGLYARSLWIELRKASIGRGIAEDQ